MSHYRLEAGAQPVSLPGENNKNHVSLQECPLTETICLGCIMLAGDTGCPPGSGLVHMKYLAVVTGARCDFIGHVPSLPSLAGSIFRLSFVIQPHAGIVSILSLSISGTCVYTDFIIHVSYDSIYPITVL